MSLKLNKLKRTAIANAAIAGLYKQTYNLSYRNTVIAVEKFVKRYSYHNHFISQPDDMLVFVNSYKSILLDARIYTTNTIDFIPKLNYIHFDNKVYAIHVNRLYDVDVIELVELRKLTKIIDEAYTELYNVLTSYNDIPNLIKDLPWIEQYTDASINPIGKVLTEQLDKLNNLFGKVK